MDQDLTRTLLERHVQREKAEARYRSAEALFENLCDVLKTYDCDPQHLPKSVRRDLLNQFIDCNLIAKDDASEIDAFWAGSTQAEDRLVRVLLGPGFRASSIDREL